MASKLLSNGTVLTFDDATSTIKVLNRASILIQGDSIAAITERPDELALPENAEVIDCQGKIISPGFVNTSIGPDVTLLHYVGWVSQASQTCRAFTPDDIYISSVAGYMEGINGGVTTYLEHAHNNWAPEVMEAGFDAAVDSGARIIWCYDVFPREDFQPEQQWKVLERLAAKQRPAELSLGLALDGLAMMRTDSATVKELIMWTLAQYATSSPEDQRSTDLYTETHSPADFCAQGLNNLGVPLVVSHAGHLDQNDITALREHNIHISITPESEFHFGHGQLTGHLVSDQASLGIDTNWTFSGDMLTQARLWLQSVRHTYYSKALVEQKSMPSNTPMTVEQGFLLATRQGGRALHRTDIGVLQVGAKADVVVFNGDSPNMVGWSNAIAAVMLHANVGDIEHVLVGGEFRKRDFKLLPKTGTWEGVKARFVATAERVQAAAFPPPPVPQKLWGQGSACEAEVASTIRRS